MDKLQQSALFERAAQACKLHGQKTLAIEFTPIQAVALLGVIQLALRHPNATGEPIQLARTYGAVIEDWLTELDPALGELARAGWRE